MHREYAYTERLIGRTIIVFGGSSGIGRELRHVVHRFGAETFSFSQTSTGTRTSNHEHVREALDQVHRATGRVDAVVTVLATGGGDRVAIAEPDSAYAVSVVAGLSAPYLWPAMGHLLVVAPMTDPLTRQLHSLAAEWSRAGAHVSGLTSTAIAGPAGVAMRCTDALVTHQSELDPGLVGSAVGRIGGSTLFGQETFQLGPELLRRG